MSEHQHMRTTAEGEGFSYVMDVRDGIIRDVTVELLLDARKHPGLGSEDLARIDAAVEALRLMPLGSVPFGRDTLCISVDWPQAVREGRPLRHSHLIVFEPGKVWMMFGYRYIPFVDPVTDGNVYFSWYADPGDRCEIDDQYRTVESMDGVLPYPAAVRSFDPLHADALVELSLDDEWDKEPELADPRLDLGYVPPVPTAEEFLLMRADEEEGRRRGILRLPAPKCCDICRADFTEENLLVDGRLERSMVWADMCLRCAVLYGAGLGWGDGQLYKRQDDGSWLCVDGFPPAEPEGEYGGADDSDGGEEER